ncbi:MAG: hypothetical protein ABI333_21875 [bacterium]
MKGSRLNMGLAVLGLTMAMVLPAAATVVLQMEIEDMIPLTPVVLIGEVNRVEASYNAEKTKIHTRVWITPSEILKGSKDLGTVVVKTIGGQVGDTVAHLPGAPRFEQGERVLVFLEPREDGEGYLTIGFYQGKFKIFKDPKTSQDMLLRDTPERGVGVVATGANHFDSKVRSLAEVRSLFAGGGQ